MQANAKKDIPLDSFEKNLTPFSKSVLKNRYLLEGETFSDLFWRVAKAYSDNDDHANRMFHYMSKLWFMPATPVLSNGGTTRGLPISCFLNESSDSLQGIVDLWNENVWLASKGGGIGSYWGNLRSIGEKVGKNGETSGVIPFMKVMDSMTLAISQGSLRRGSAAIYLPIDHPEVEEFIEIRRPTGGDHNRKALNTHHGIAISDEFMEAVEKDEMWPLRSPKDRSIVREVSARGLWIRILTSRMETGEPYCLFIDHVQKNQPDIQKKLGLKVKTSNLCSEITLPTGLDHLGEERTAVCCLSSLNLEKFQEWENDALIVEDCLRFLDNVLEDFTARAPSSMKRAIYAAKRERSVGLGVMGFHSFLQKKNVPFEGVMAKTWNNKIFKHIKNQADKASKKLALEKGACPDAQDCGAMERFSNKLAIAPTASISIICGESSPGIEPYAANAYTHKTLSGSFPVKNKHLRALLKEKGKDTNEIWSSIIHHHGSVQHLDFLSEHEKNVFKTAFELNQNWVVDLAADRQKYICQAQSLNLFLQPTISKKDLHQIHKRAWEKGLKSLYYARSLSIQRAESVQKIDTSNKTEMTPINQNYEECLSCQ